MNSTKFLRVTVCITLLAVLLAACGPPETIVETWTEADLQQEDLLCHASGLASDLQPGKVVCTGVLDGDDVVIELVPEIVDGAGRLKILRASVNGEAVAAEDIASMNAERAQETFNADEGYVVTSIVITDNDLTITASLK